MENLEFKQHPTLELFVSKCGVVKKRNGKLYGPEFIYTKGTVSTKGYLTVRPPSLNNKIFKMELIHRLVIETYLPNTDITKNLVNHKNSIKTDNRLENLEWCDNSFNIQHAYDNGKCEAQRESLRKIVTERNKVRGNNHTSISICIDNVEFKTLKCATEFYNVKYANAHGIYKRNGELAFVEYLKKHWELV